MRHSNTIEKKRRWSCQYLAVLCLVGSALTSAVYADPSVFEDVVVSNSFQQAGETSESYFTGSLGVGTNDPASTEKLHVVGDTRMDGSLTVSGAVEVPKQGDINMGGFTNGVADAGVSLGSGVAKGYITGCYVEFNNVTSVTVTAGEGVCNGNFFAVTNDTAHYMTSLATAQDYHYICIDDSASTYPTPIFIDSTTEPIWSDAKLGFYSGDDRCIGAVLSSNGVSHVAKFQTFGTGRIMFNDVSLICANNHNPNGGWQAPNTTATSAVLPVNAVSAHILAYGRDLGSVYICAVTTEEHADVNPTYHMGQYMRYGYDRMMSREWVGLGPSRNLEILGSDDDDNNLALFVTGYEVRR